MRDLTARRLRTLVHLMAERSTDRAPSTPGALLEEVITAVPRDPEDLGGPRGGLFEEFLRATDSLQDTGLLAKEEAGWYLTASGRAAARSPSALGEALGRMEVSGAAGSAVDRGPQPAPPARMVGAAGSERPPRTVGLAGGFLPAGGPARAADQRPFTGALRPAWAADDPGLRLSHDAEDVWSLTLALEPGHYEYKVVLGSSWKENYGVRGMRSGPNLVLDLPAPQQVTFTFDHVTKLPASA